MQEQGQKKLWSIGLYLFGRLTALLVLPLIIAVYIGKLLDNHYNSEPWLFLATLGIAFILSNILIVKESIKAMDAIQKDGKVDEKLDTKK